MFAVLLLVGAARPARARPHQAEVRPSLSGPGFSCRQALPSQPLTLDSLLLCNKETQNNYRCCIDTSKPPMARLEFLC